MIVEVAGVGKDYARAKSKKRVSRMSRERFVATRNENHGDDEKQVDIHCLKLFTFLLTMSKHEMRFSTFPSVFAVQGRCMTLTRTTGGAGRAAGRGTLCFLPPALGMGVERAEPRELLVAVFVVVASSETRGRLDAS